MDTASVVRAELHQPVVWRRVSGQRFRAGHLTEQRPEGDHGFIFTGREQAGGSHNHEQVADDSGFLHWSVVWE